MTKKSLFVAAATAPILVSGAFAQTDNGEAAKVEEAAGEASSRKLDTIVVEARKQEESLQDVPVVVQAFDSEVLEALGTSNFKDLNSLVAGLSVYTEGTLNPKISLRGVTGNDINAMSDEPVSVVMDGVAHSSSQIFRYGLFDVEAIEVLKGPQALFFGKNSPGGIIAVRTKMPTDEFFTEVQTGYEFNGERVYGHGIISGPLSENWGARLAVKGQDSEGFFTNTFGDGDEDDPTVAQPFNDKGPNYSDILGIGTLRGEFDRGEVVLKALYGHREGGQYNQVQNFVCGDDVLVDNPYSDCTLNDTFATAPFTSNDDVLNIVNFQTAPATQAADKPTQDYKLAQITLDASFDLTDEWSVHSITGYVNVDNYYFGNVAERSLVPSQILGFAQYVDVEQFSQELRFSGDFGRFRTTLGAFVDDRRTDSGGNVWVTQGVTLVPDSEVYVGQSSWSAFAQAELDITDRLSLSVGGRYTDEERDTGGGFIGQPDARFNMDPDTLSEDNFSPEVTLSWDATDDLNFFANYKEGFKSGGFNASYLDRAVTAGNPDNAIDDSFLSETVAGFELGFKSEWFDNTLRINGAAYSYDYDELQLSVVKEVVVNGVASPVVSTDNAGSSKIEGIELDALWLTPLEGLSLTGVVAYNDSKFTDYISECSQYQLFTDPAGCDVNVDTSGANGGLDTSAGGIFDVITDNGFDSQDRRGTPLTNSPEWSLSLGANYETSLSSNLGLAANFLTSYNGDQNASADNNPLAVQDAHFIVNGGLQLFAKNGGWDLELIGRNLTDEVVLIDAFNQSRSGSATEPQYLGGVRNAPREIMLQLTIRPQALFN